MKRGRCPRARSISYEAEMSEQSELPKWREDFPFETENDEHITRRDCARFVVLVSGGLTFGSGLVALRAAHPEERPRPAPVDLGESKDLGKGAQVPFHFGEEPALLVRRADGR